VSKLKCTCNSSYRSPGDYALAIKMGWDVEYTHALLDLWENCLDEVLDDRRQTDNILEDLKEEYGRTVTVRPDQADS
jgi:hypothetical protein